MQGNIPTTIAMWWNTSGMGLTNEKEFVSQPFLVLSASFEMFHVKHTHTMCVLHSEKIINFLAMYKNCTDVIFIHFHIKF